MYFRKLAEYFDKLDQTASRLMMTRILAEVFEEASADEIDKICYLSLGRLVPLYENLEFNLAEKMVMRALAGAFNVEVKNVLSKYKKVGDLGKVVEELSKSKRKSKLTVEEVYLGLRKIAEDNGQGSQERKINGLVKLINSLDTLSSKYVVRMVLGKLRLGFLDKTLIDGLSWMVRGDKSLREELEQAYFVRADIGELARRVKNEKLKVKSGLKNVKPKLGVPIMPALCQRLRSAEEMIAKMGRVAVEPKFDGIRVAIHMRGKELLKTFTRNLEETTHMFPELKQAYKQIKAREVVLDSEAVGMDPKTGKLVSFQEMMVRKRKHKIEEVSRRVPVKFFVFDVLYKNGRSLLKLPLRERRKILEEILVKGGPLELTEQIVTERVEKLREYHLRQLKEGLEGVVVKQWDDPYTSGRRGFSWVKFKEEEEAAGGLSDTLDCVVMGYYRGRGKRVGFGIGAFLVGVRRGEKLVTIAKVGTGLSDEQWREIKKRSTKFEIRNKPKEYVEVNKMLIPDVWVEPAIVVEIAADNITRSPVHSAGVALRFPRLVRFREDKNVDQATTLREVEKLYKM